MRKLLVSNTYRSAAAGFRISRSTVIVISRLWHHTAAQKILWLYCISCQDINALEHSLRMTLLNHTKNFVVIMADAIADHYCRPHQSGGFYKQIGVKYGHAVPLQRNAREPYLERSSGKGGTVESKDYAKLASQAREAQRRKRAADSDSDGECKRMINNKKKKKKKKEQKKISKHKRNRIDEALGDDTYYHATSVTSRGA